MSNRKTPALSQAAVEARRAYKRRWAAQNRDKLREYNYNFWEKKAREYRAAQEQEAPHE